MKVEQSLRMMIFLKIRVFFFIGIFLTISSFQLSAAGVETDFLCINLSKKYRYFKKLNDKVSFLINKNRKLLSDTPKRKESVARKLNFVLSRLQLERKKLRIKLTAAELNLVKKKCPSYEILSRFNL